MLKKLSGACVATLIMVSSAQAFDIKGAAKDVAKAGGHVAAQNKINDELAKQNCTYANDTAIEPTCNIKKIIASLTAFNRVAEKSDFADDVDINITAHHPKKIDIARKRAEYLRDQIKLTVNYWDFSVYYEKGGNKADIKVDIN